MNSRPGNSDAADVKSLKERAVSTAFLQYLAGTGKFSSWKNDRDEYKVSMVRFCLCHVEFYLYFLQDGDPVAVWTAFGSMSSETKELSRFAVDIFKIVVNQAGCERVFSDLKIKQTQRRNRLSLAKLDKMTKVS